MTPQYLPVPAPTSGMAVGSIIAIGILLLISVILGFLGKKKWKTFDEYLVGKRDIGPIITGCALSASYLSGWAFCGSTGVVYTVGFSGMWFAGIWSLLGLIPCIWLAARKTRDFSDKLKAATVPETIGKRFESKALQAIIAVCMLYFLFMYSIGQLKAAGGVWYASPAFPLYGAFCFPLLSPGYTWCSEDMWEPSGRWPSRGCCWALSEPYWVSGPLSMREDFLRSARNSMRSPR